MIVLVIHEAVDPEERNLRLHKIVRYRSIQRGAERLARSRIGRGSPAAGLHGASAERADLILKKFRKPKRHRGPENRALRMLNKAVKITRASKMGRIAWRKPYSDAASYALSLVKSGVHRKKTGKSWKATEEPVLSLWYRHLNRERARRDS